MVEKTEQACPLRLMKPPVITVEDRAVCTNVVYPLLIKLEELNFDR